MATLIASSSPALLAVSRPVATPAYDWGMAFTASCMGLGAYIDGWAHNHALATGGSIETFFTPWHALLYGGFALVAVALLATMAYWRAQGYAWMNALPQGYRLSLTGVAVFTLGGILDMMWHLLFGIEVSTNALLSPTHIMLVVGAVLIYMGPARSVLARAPEAGWRASGPLVLSLVWLLSSFTFFTQYASPFASTISAAIRNPHTADWVDLFEAFGVAAIAVQAAFLSGVILYGVKLKRLPFGAFAVLMGVNVALMSLMRIDFVVVTPLILTGGALVAGLLADLLYRQLAVTEYAGWRLKVFACCAPALLYAIYFASIVGLAGTYWTIHLITGSVVTAGIIGLLLSYLIAPVQDVEARA
ncbi:MAG: hypothetical protein NVSMB31_19500 [Vulcanimicrobiaceae bacterium]